MKALLEDEQGSGDAALLWDRASDVISASVGFVEMQAAIARRVAVRRAPHLRRRATNLWQSVNVVDVDDALVQAAARAAEEFRLRALDAVHLAAARSVASRDLVFATWDEELSEAARAAGLAVAP